MERIVEYVSDGKSFVSIDLSGLNSVAGLAALLEVLNSVFEKYPELSVYLLINAAKFTFDSEIKSILADSIAQNKKKVKAIAVFGADGAKKLLISSMIKLADRTNMRFTFTKEKAVEWLLSLE